MKIKSSYEYLAEPDPVAAFEERNKALNFLGRKSRERTAKPGNKLKVVSQVVDIFSDNVRMTATLWKPEAALDAPNGSFPAILLCHGWGGIRDHLDARFALEFARAGFVALSFDYRGWNDSDGVVVASHEDSREIQDHFRGLGKAQLSKARSMPTNVKVIRETVDMEWQLTDIQAAFHYLEGVDVVDAKAIGIWGISQGVVPSNVMVMDIGGHVITIAAKLRDKVKAAVAQVPSCGIEGAGSIRSKGSLGREKGIAQAQGAISLPQSVPETHLEGMDGSPVLPKLCAYAPLDTAELIQCPVLVIDAEGEEMFDPKANGKRAYEIVSVKNPSSQYMVLPGRHYDAYDGSLDQFNRGTEVVIEFFKKHLASTMPSNL